MISIPEFTAFCRYLYGGSWHTALARETIHTKQEIEMMASGHLPITSDVLIALAGAYKRRIAGLERRLIELESR